MPEAIPELPEAVTWLPFCGTISCSCMEPNINGPCGEYSSNGINPRCAECGWPKHRHTTDHLFSPGELIRHMLATKRLCQADVSRATGYSTKHISEVVRDVVPMTTDFAYALQVEHGLDALRLLNTQNRWQLRQRELLDAAAQARSRS